MRSMTGFGAGSASTEALSVTIEMRAVNQRFLELNIRMPRAYLALEDHLRQAIKQVLHRGKVDVFVSVTELMHEAPAVHIDYAALQAIKDAVDEAKKRVFDGSPATLKDVTVLSTDWFSQEPPAIDIDACQPVFDEALQAALAGMVAMREREGANIAADLTARADAMSSMIDAIAAKKDILLEQYEDRLKKRIAAFLEGLGTVPDEARVLQEVAIYADKTDVTEEIVRFRSHVVQLRQFLASTGDMGRKLDFLIQEMNREVNTIGSKASDTEVTASVLKLKNEIEKLREQIQNIE